MKYWKMLPEKLRQAIIVGLVGATWKGTPNLSKKLNIGALALLFLFVNGVYLGIFVPLIKIRQAMDGQ